MPASLTLKVRHAECTKLDIVSKLAKVRQRTLPWTQAYGDCEQLQLLKASPILKQLSLAAFLGPKHRLYIY